VSYSVSFKVPENLILNGTVMGVFVDWLGDYSVGEIKVQDNNFFVQTVVKEEDYDYVIEALTQFFQIKREEITIKKT
jgi:hypothetical protein